MSKKSRSKSPEPVPAEAAPALRMPAPEPSAEDLPPMDLTPPKRSVEAPSAGAVPLVGKARARVPVVARIGIAMMATAALMIALDVPAMISDDGKDPSFNVVAANAATLPATEIAAVAAPVTSPATVQAAVPAPQEGPGLRAVLKSTEEIWGGIFKQTGLAYQAPLLAAQGAIGSGACAGAEVPGAAMYCAANGTIYVDPAAPPTAALGFDIAHEVGHHIQALLGLGLSTDVDGADLQADCFAGVWAISAGGITPEQLSQALEGFVGARVASFAVGYSSGSPMACQDMLSAQL